MPSRKKICRAPSLESGNPGTQTRPYGRQPRRAVDAVVVADVYAAGEAPIDGIDRDHFVEGLRAHGHREVVPLPAAPELAGIVKRLAKSGDLVVCLGAGNITQWAYALPDQLKALG